MTLSMGQLDTGEDAAFRDPVFAKMEALIRQMQDPNRGIQVRCQKTFLSSIPCAFPGYDVVEWLMDHLQIEDQEAHHLATLLCHFGYFFPVNESKVFTIKDDNMLFRFQTPYFWPSHHQPDNTDYAIYLVKRTLGNKPRHCLEEFEQEALARLKKLLCHKWEFICSQAAEQANLLRDRKKADKVVLESQEKAYWHVYRPPPGCTSFLEQSPIANKRTREKRLRKDSKTDIEKLKQKADIPKHQISQALEGLIHSTEETEEFDPFLHGCFPSNPWITEDTAHWTLNQPLVDIPTERRLKKWTISLDHLLGDPTGLREFEEYLKKEFSYENIAFWRAVQELKRSGGPLESRIQDIHDQFLEPGAPSEVNLDSRTLENTLEALKKPSRHVFEQAQQHVFQLMKSDTYPRFLRSDHYRGLCEKAQSQICQKKRFCNFGSIRGRRSRLQPEPEQGRWLFSGRHSHSTSDLHNLDNGAAAKPAPANSTLSSPSGSRECVNDQSATITLQVPPAPPAGTSSPCEDCVTIAVPKLVAPWESDQSDN